MKLYKNQNGFSLVEVVIASAIVSVVGVALMNITGNSVKNLKNIDEKKYLSLLTGKLTAKLENDVECNKIFNPLPGSLSWSTLTQQKLELDDSKINAHFADIYGIHMGKVDQNQDKKNFSSNFKISGIEIDKMDSLFGPLESLGEGELGAVSIPVKFPVKKINETSSGSSGKYLTRKPISIVVVFKKNGTSFSFDHCYARGSSFIFEAREICNSMGGAYIDEGCRFIQFGGNAGTYNKYQVSSVGSNSYQKIQDILCELDKKVILIEKTPLNPVLDPVTSAVLIPGVPAKNSTTRYCSTPVNNF